MAYKFSLPNHSKTHLVFRIPFLKIVVGSNCKLNTRLPNLDEEGSVWLHLSSSLYSREQKLHRNAIKEFIIQWKGMIAEDAIWEPTNILNQFSHLQRCGQCLF